MGLLPQEYKLSQELSEQFKAMREQVIKDAFTLFDERAKQHDAESPFWHRYPFGDQSYAQMVFETAGRLVSAVRAGLQFAKVEDRLLDLINWATMWLAWRRMERDAPPQMPETADPAPLDINAIQPLGTPVGLPPSREPDATGAVETPKRKRLSLKRS